MHIYIYMYVYVCIYTYVCIYIYIHIYLCGNESKRCVRRPAPTTLCYKGMKRRTCYIPSRFVARLKMTKNSVANGGLPRQAPACYIPFVTGNVASVGIGLLKALHFPSLPYKYRYRCKSKYTYIYIYTLYTYINIYGCCQKLLVPEVASFTKKATHFAKL